MTKCEAINIFAGADTDGFVPVEAHCDRAATGRTEDGCAVCPECAEEFRNEGFEVLDSYQREWANQHNAAGFAAECARLALPFYEGDRRPDLVTDIESVERYSRGGKIGVRAARDTPFSNAAAAVQNAYDVVICHRSANIGLAAADAAYSAGFAGVDDHSVDVAYARWVVRDLSGGRELLAELRQAAGAAVVTGDEALARELIDEDLARALVQGEAC